MINFVEKYIVPVAAKIGSEKHLIALRDGFIAMMPITMTGAIAVFLNALIRDFPSDPAILGPGNFITNNAFSQWLIGINGIVWGGTLAVIALCLAITLGYNLARAYNVDGVAGSVIAFAAYILGIPQMAHTTTTIAIPEAYLPSVIAAVGDQAVVEGGNLIVSGAAWGFFQFSQFFNPVGMFGVMIATFISVIIFCLIYNAGWTIKMPDSVPPAVSKAFSALIPGFIALYIMAVLYWLWGLASDVVLSQWIAETIQAPLLGATQNYWMVLIIVLLNSLLWFFGLHGGNILGPVLNASYGIAQIENVEAFAMGHEIPFLWASGSFDAFVFFGGSGSTFALVLAILFFSKREDYKTIGKLSLGPGAFNINEPIIFGLPIVLNPLMFIPFILAPVVTVTIAYAATMAGIVGPVVIPVVWVMPPVLNAFFATAFDPMAIVLTVLNIAVAFAIYLPFIIAANSIAEKEQQ